MGPTAPEFFHSRYVYVYIYILLYICIYTYVGTLMRIIRGFILLYTNYSNILALQQLY